MASSTKNVRVGPCYVYFGGINLGLTKGGVEVDIKTETYKSEVDQFGKTPITELIQARVVTAKVPMAETTILNFARVFPGATVSQVGGVAATGTLTLATNPADGDSITLNGLQITFKTAVTTVNQVLIGATSAATAANLVAFLSSSNNHFTATAIFVQGVGANTNKVTATYYTQSVEGNTFTLASAQASVTVSGPALTGGVDPTSMSLSSTDGVGVNLLSVVDELRLHPMDRAETDYTDDFVIFNAATAGAAKFAYKIENERVFDCEFTGFPDTATRKLFGVGIAP